MQQTITGQIVLSNLMFELLDNGLSDPSARSLVAKIESVWTFDGTTWPDQRGESPLTVFASICTPALVEVWLSGTPAPVIKERVSRVVSADDLLAHNVVVSDYAGLIGDLKSDRVLECIESDGLIPGTAVGEMRGRNPVAWITKTGELTALRASTEPSKLPAATRDKLGLRHIVDEVLLVEIQYPDDSLVGRRTARPTVVDAGPGLIFRSCRTPDGWGAAVDLATLEYGFPELVHEPLAFNPRFKVKRLGYLDSTIENFSFGELLDKCPRKWDSAMIEHLEALR